MDAVGSPARKCGAQAAAAHHWLKRVPFGCAKADSWWLRSARARGPRRIYNGRHA